MTFSAARLPSLLRGLIPCVSWTFRRGWLPLLAAVLLSLAGCGGAGGGGSAPATPGKVQATGGDARVTLNWEAAAGASGYVVYWSNTDGFSPAAVSRIDGITAPPYDHTGLTNGTPYYYVVSAVNDAGESAPSAEVGATPQMPAPGAPTGFAAAPGDGQVTLSWNAAAGATGYTLYWSTAAGVSPATGTRIDNIAATTYIHTGLTNATTYRYVLTALNPGGESAPTGEVNATPSVPAPTGLTAGVVQGQARLSWDAVKGASAYTLYWSTAAGVTTASGTKVALGAVTQATVTDLTAGTTYYFIVTATKAGVESGPSATVSVTPPSAPTNLTATRAGSNVSLSWTAVNGASSYTLYWSTTAGKALQGTAVGSISGSAYTFIPPTAGLTYYFVVTATTGASESGPSAEQGVVTLPAAPTGLGATLVAQAIQVTWDTMPEATSYNIYWDTTSGVTSASPNKLTNVTSNPQSISGFCPATTLYLVVTAENAAGEGPISSEASVDVAGLCVQ